MSKIHGYGIKPRGSKTGYNMAAHRWVWEREVGPIPEGMQLHHRCHNRLCVNVDHLELMDPSAHKKAHIAEDGLSGVAAVHAAKTHCKNGHPSDAHNGYQRICTACRRKYKREWARKKYGVKKPRVA